jgi:hypothetical protein
VVCACLCVCLLPFPLLLTSNPLPARPPAAVAPPCRPLPLQPGDCVVLNAPDSTVGRAAIQLARLLRLRVLALLRPPPKDAAAAAGGGAPGAAARAGGEASAAEPGAAGAAGGGEEGAAAAPGEARWRQVAGRLEVLGATHVLRDEGAIQAGAPAGGGGGQGPQAGCCFCPRASVGPNAHKARGAARASLFRAPGGRRRPPPFAPGVHAPLGSSSPRRMQRAAPPQGQLEALRYFSRPTLALDAVGGESAGRMADALADVRERARLPGRVGGRAGGWRVRDPGDPLLPQRLSSGVNPAPGA